MPETESPDLVHILSALAHLVFKHHNKGKVPPPTPNAIPISSAPPPMTAEVGTDNQPPNIIPPPPSKASLAPANIQTDTPPTPNIPLNTTAAFTPPPQSPSIPTELSPASEDIPTRLAQSFNLPQQNLPMSTTPPQVNEGIDPKIPSAFGGIQKNLPPVNPASLTKPDNISTKQANLKESIPYKRPSPIPLKTQDIPGTGNKYVQQIAAQPKPSKPTPQVKGLVTPTPLVTSSLSRVYHDPADEQRAHVIIDADSEVGYVVKNHSVIRAFPISLGKGGIGNQKGQSPGGLMEISKIAGKGLPLGAVMRGGQPVYENGKLKIAKIEKESSQDEPLMTTRYLYIKGLEPENKDILNSGRRIHGTNLEGNLGHVDSHGCYRFPNEVVQDLADNVLTEGSKLLVVHSPGADLAGLVKKK